MPGSGPEPPPVVVVPIQSQGVGMFWMLTRPSVVGAITGYLLGRTPPPELGWIPVRAVKLPPPR